MSRAHPDHWGPAEAGGSAGRAGIVRHDTSEVHAQESYPEVESMDESDAEPRTHCRDSGRQRRRRRRRRPRRSPTSSARPRLGTSRVVIDHLILALQLTNWSQS
jgi:hypothetical protein